MLSLRTTCTASRNVFGRSEHLIPAKSWSSLTVVERRGCLSDGPQQWLRAQYFPFIPSVFTNRICSFAELPTSRMRSAGIGEVSSSMTVSAKDLWHLKWLDVHLFSQV
jgi:hypothetical protein